MTYLGVQCVNAIAGKMLISIEYQRIIILPMCLIK